MLFTLNPKSPGVDKDNHGYLFMTGELREYLLALPKDVWDVTKFGGNLIVSFTNEEDAIMCKLAYTESIL